MSAALLLLALLGCRGPGRQPLVLLISWDTTRADALSCYAEERLWRPDEPDLGPHTPVADALAAGGLRFRWAFAHAPTTLSSHSSVMSGRDGHGHRVVRNGYPVPPELPLLAERFSAAGWDTIAVVGASTLEASMGLSRGFRIYDDRVGTKVRQRYEDRADRVTERALRRADERRDRPLLLFVHYFDPHSPWDSASEAVRARFPEASGADPGPLVPKALDGSLSRTEARGARAAYLAEVAWTDEQTGRLLEGLRRRGLLDHALIALFADHGEVLDDPGAWPYGHGPDADPRSLHVPLILHGTGRFSLSVGVDDRPARLMDLGATVLARAGIAGGLGEGQDLLARAEVPPSFAEATKPEALERTDAWNNLDFDRSVVAEGHLYRQSRLTGRRALHALAAGAPTVEDAALEPALRARIEAWDALAPGFRAARMSTGTEEALRALGYLDDGQAAPGGAPSSAGP